MGVCLLYSCTLVLNERQQEYEHFENLLMKSFRHLVEQS